MEHSKKEERVYLFSLFTFIILMASMLGSVLGGLLSGLGGLLLSRAPGDAASLRFALAVAIPLMFLSLVPIYLIKENWQRQKLSAWFKGIKSWSILGMLAITTGLAGLAMGFTFPFYNVYFNYLGASPPVIGAIFAAGSLAGALGTALAPLVESKLGKVKTITAARLVSVPFLMGIVLFPLLPISALFYLGRRASMTLGFPVRALFRMEIVGEQERGATTGLVHAMAQFPIGISAWMAGSMMARDDWVTPYAWASILLIGSAAVFFFYFGPLEKKLNRLP
jgi:MFS family permease